MKKYYYLMYLIKRTAKKFAKKQAEHLAWNRCVRVFRGTDCHTPGICYTRDLIYLEGNLSVWKVILNNPQEIKRFNVGSYDPGNARHLWLLNKLGI